MTSKQALSALRKLLGSKAGLRDRRRTSSPELRAEQRAAWLAVKVRAEAASERLAERRAIVLNADPVWRVLLTEYQAAVKAKVAAPRGYCYRYTAGTAGSLFFTVTAEADTLPQLIEAVKGKVKP